MIKNYCLRLLFSVMFVLFGLLTYGQSININTMTPADHPLTIPQTSTYTTNNGSGAVTWIIKNTNAFPAILDTVHYFIQGAGTQQTQLWYSATSLTGNNGGQAVSAATGWTQITTQNVNAPLANTMQPLLSGLNFVIPGNTTYRFQIIRTGLGYAGQGTFGNPIAQPAPDSFSNSGVVLGSGMYTIGANVAANSVSYGQATFGFNPRGFVGKCSFTLQSTPCTGVPNHDTIIGNMNPCPGVSTCYYLTGNNPNSGLTYQWFESAVSATGPWTIMTNDTNSSNCFLPPVPGPTWYTCVTTCVSSGLSDTATAIAVTPATFSPFSPCYCGNSSPTINTLTDIGQFNIGTLSNPGVAPPQLNNPLSVNTYSNFDTLTPVPTFIQGQTYPVSMVQTCSNGSSYTGWTKAWIDYDHNTAWDDNPLTEQVFSSAVDAGNTYAPSGTFTVPTTAQPGLTRLRTVLRQAGTAANTLPCGSYTFYGETEDYIVNILAAGPADPAVTNIQVSPLVGCLDSCETVVVTLANFGSQNLDFNTNNLIVKLNVDGPNGQTVYTDTVTTGILTPFASNNAFVFFSCVNFHEGGTYSVNTDTLTLLGGAVNTNLVNDSLFTPVAVHNSRPNSGGDYTLCIGDTIPTGNGLSILNCPTGYVQDSVLIPFTLSFSGNAVPNPTQCSALGASQFASATLPVLPASANILSGELGVSNLQLAGLTFTTAPNLTRFSLFNGPTPPPAANVYHNGLPGTTLTANVVPFDYVSNPPAVDLNTMYTGGVPTAPIVNVGHWNTNRCTAPNVSVNSNGTTTVYLKLIYEYIPVGVKWYEAKTGGISISGASVFNPLNTTNNILNNSNTAGTYTFFGGCAADTNCRVEVSVNVTGLTYASIVDTGVTCNGGTDGSILATVNGVGPTYTLYQGATQVPGSPNTSGYFSNLAAGTYTLNATDASGCSSGDSLIVITEPGPIVFDTALVTNVLCTGDTSGQIQVHATGSGIAYQVNPPSATQTSGTFTGLGANAYTVRASHSNGACFADTNLNILEPATAVDFDSVGVQSVSCFGGSDGKIYVSGTGGTPGTPASYRFAIIAPAASATPIGVPVPANAVDSFINLSPGSYTVAVYDSNDCVKDSTVIVLAPAQLVISGVATDVLCFGDSSGSITMSHTGGTGAVIYSPALTGLPMGTYTITGTDANGCTATTSVTINQPASAVQVTNVTSTTPSCVPGCDATMTITAAGGTAPAYSYNNGLLAAPGQGSNQFTAQCAGNYTITVTDANGCTATSTHVISTPGAPSWVTPVVPNNVSCNGGSDGSFTLTTTGGTGAVTQVMTSPAVNPGTFTAPGTYTNMPAGSYTIVATDANGCSILTVVTVSEPPVLSLNTPAITNVVCNGDTTGAVSITATGGTPTYTYTLGTQSNTTGNFTGLGAGGYTITVTDANNCTASTNITLTQPTALSYTSVSSNNVSCFGQNNGGITAAGAGGTGILNISLTPGPGAPQTSPATFTGLGGGAQTIRITDGAGCTLDSVVTIIEPAALVISTSSVQQVLCFGDSSGTIVMSHTGGTGVPSYVMTNQPTGVLQAPVGTYNNVPAGTYTITGTDGSGCTAVTTVTITAPATAVQITNITGITPSCVPGNDGSITATASGGTGAIDFFLPPSTTPSTGTFSNLASGSYLVQAVDQNGCIDTMTYVLSNANAPTFASAITSLTNCFGDSTGSMTVQATNTPPSVITYSVIAPAAWTGLAPQSSLGTVTFNNLPAGTYTVQAVDANNCPVVSAVTINQPTQVSITSVTTDSVDCNGGSDGSIVLTATGGTGALSATPTPNVQLPAGTFTFSNLAANTYAVQVQDGNGCTADSSIIVSEPAGLVISTSSTSDVLCNGDATGGLVIQGTGGSGTITYSIPSLAAPNSNTTGIFTGLAAGAYNVVLTDGSGCTTNTNITINEPAALGQTQVTSNVSCFGGNDGEIVVTGMGGISPYLYNLLPTNPGLGTADTFSNLTAGTMYQTIVSDSNGCVDTSGLIVITEPTQVLFTAVSKTDIECYGASTGSISAAAAGGTGAVTISVTAGPVMPTAQGSPAVFNTLPAGTYQITATDANGCTAITNVTIIENPPIVFTISNTEEKCYGDGTAVITFLASGGVSPFVYRFDDPTGTYNGQTVYSNLSSGTYLIEARDALGCEVDTNYTLTGPDPITFTQFDITPTTCLDTEDGRLTVVATGGRGNVYNYSLEPGFYVNTSGIFRDLAPKAYVLRVTDTAGCYIDTNLAIPLPTNPMVVSIDKVDLGCHGRGNEGTAEAIVTGGTPPYTYFWSSTPVQTTAQAVGLYEGLHTVDVVDAQGCLERDTLMIEAGPCCQEVFLPNAFSPNGDGRNDEFRILSTADMELQQFEVYNRWGIRIWQTNNLRSSWDGTYGGEAVQAETYYYVLKYKCLTDGQQYTKKGDVIVVR